MAIIDPDRDAIVIRIIYDGPPLSGKTTSVQTLGRLLGRTTSIFSPEEIEGKTLFFDWMEYVGGLFKGYSISCQIVSVPGQLFLEARRHFLLRTADAVVFVLDASDDPAVPVTYFQNLQTIITQDHDLPIKVIIQANKQDKPNALTAQQLKPYFQDYPQVKIVESSALLSKGLRESFVLGVRLAVERAELLMTKGQLKQGKPEISSSEELLAALQSAVQLTSENASSPGTDLKQVVESSEEINLNLLLKTADSPALDTSVLLETSTIIPSSEPEQPINKPTSSLVPSISEESHLPSTHSSSIAPEISSPVTEKIPILPHLDLPMHFLWPPFQTRELLPILSILPPPELQEHYWLTYNNHWACFSKNAWQYQELEEGYSHFQTQLKWHLHCSPLLPSQRALVLATQSLNSQQCRLWQIVPHSATTLMAQFHALWQLPSLDKISLELFRNLIYYVDVQQPMQRYFPTTQVNLQEIMLNPEGELYYLGPIDFTPSSSLETVDLATAIMTLYQPLIEQNLLHNQIDATQLIQELQKIDGFEQQYLIEILTTLLSRISN